LSLGIVTSIFFKLWLLAPLITIFCIYIWYYYGINCI